MNAAVLPTAIPRPRRQIWSIGGGKGGIGKSILTASLGWQLARMGKRVVLVDADLGGDNLHTCLGLSSPPFTMGDFIKRRVERIEDVLVDAGTPGLRLLSGASDFLGAANIKDPQKVRVLNRIRALDVDVVLLDLSLPGEIQGLDLARAIRSEGLPVRILVLTARTDEEALFESVIAGVEGYLEKTSGVRVISDALSRVARGERIFTQAQMRGAVVELSRRARQARGETGTQPELSAREIEVLEHAARGFTVGQVARRLELSPRTVETHLGNAYRKLGVSNRVQALARASELGLIRIG